MASTRFKIDPLTIGLAVLAVVCIAVGAAIVSGHPKRGGLAFVIGILAGRRRGVRRHAGRQGDRRGDRPPAE